jgi:hypothetical protein
MRSPSLEGWVGQERCTSQRCEGLRAVAIAGLEPDVPPDHNRSPLSPVGLNRRLWGSPRIFS